MPGRGERLSSEEQALALATRRAIEAAGGLEACAQVAAVAKSQLQRCTSPQHHDSITIRDAVAIESIGHGRPGHPHITLAMARAQGFVLIRLPQGEEDGDGLLMSVVSMTKELGDVAERIADALADGVVSAREAQIALLELGDLEEMCAAMRVRLQRLAGMSPEVMA